MLVYQRVPSNQSRGYVDNPLLTMAIAVRPLQTMQRVMGRTELEVAGSGLFRNRLLFQINHSGYTWIYLTMITSGYNVAILCHSFRSCIPAFVFLVTPDFHREKTSRPFFLASSGKPYHQELYPKDPVEIAKRF